jgi:hypothetical protein
VARRLRRDESLGGEWPTRSPARMLTPSSTCPRVHLASPFVSGPSHPPPAFLRPPVVPPPVVPPLQSRLTPQECQVVAPLQLYFSWTSAVAKMQPWRFLTTFCYFGKVSLDLCFHLFFV